MTYREAENKIIQAYYRDEIEPLNPEFCFCGTLNGGSQSWMHRKKGLKYTPHEFASMEEALLMPFEAYNLVVRMGITPGDWAGDNLESLANFEDVLFEGMSNALDVLKQIHISRGEKIDEEVTFKKRELVL